MRKVVASIVLLLSILALGIPSKAQESITAEKKISFGGVASLSATKGLHLQAAMRFMPELSVRGGIAFFPTISVYQHVFALDNSAMFDAYKQEGAGYKLGIDFKATYGSFTGQLLLDYHPFRSPFRITAGAYLGAPTVHAAGYFIDTQSKKSILEFNTPLDPKDLPKVSIINAKDPNDVVEIQPCDQAGVSASGKLGRFIQPYLGVGYGWAVPKSRVSFFMDFGMLFAGQPRLTSPNVKKGDPTDLINYSATAQDVAYWMQIIPLLTLGVSMHI